MPEPIPSVQSDLNEADPPEMDDLLPEVAARARETSEPHAASIYERFTTRESASHTDLAEDATSEQPPDVAGAGDSGAEPNALALAQEPAITDEPAPAGELAPAD